MHNPAWMLFSGVVSLSLSSLSLSFSLDGPGGSKGNGVLTTAGAVSLVQRTRLEILEELEKTKM
jgi:hypothetical protein